MRTVWSREGALAGLVLVFLLSFALPAIGEWSHPTQGLRGAQAALGAIMLFSHLSGEPGGVILTAVSVQSNLFFVWGWLCVAGSSPHHKCGRSRLLMAWGLISFALALAPMLCFRPTNLLVGYYLWVSSIGLLALWVWLGRQEEQPTEPPLMVGGAREYRYHRGR